MEQISSPFYIIASRIGVFLFYVEEPFLYPYRTTGKIIVLCALNLRGLGKYWRFLHSFSQLSGSKNPPDLISISWQL